MSNLHDTDYQIQLKKGTASNIHITATLNSAVSAEPHWTTDTCKLFVFCGTDTQRVHGNDMVVCFDDEIISFNNEVVWLEKIRTSTYAYA